LPNFYFTTRIINNLPVINVLVFNFITSLDFESIKHVCNVAALLWNRMEN